MVSITWKKNIKEYLKKSMGFHKQYCFWVLSLQLLNLQSKRTNFKPHPNLGQLSGFYDTNVQNL